MSVGKVKKKKDRYTIFLSRRDTEHPCMEGEGLKPNRVADGKCCSKHKRSKVSLAWPLLKKTGGGIKRKGSGKRGTWKKKKAGLTCPVKTHRKSPEG